METQKHTLICRKLDQTVLDTYTHPHNPSDEEISEWLLALNPKWAAA